MYLSKYRHENFSPNLVPVAKHPGSSSPPIDNYNVFYPCTIMFRHNDMISVVWKTMVLFPTVNVC